MTTALPSSLEIAQAATLRPIEEIAALAGLEPDEVEPYGRTKAKVDLAVLDRLRDTEDGKLVCVTAITPTKAGEGKTTTSVSLTQGLGHIGRRPVLCLREASLGPVFGIKGGAAGGGYAQVVPMEDLNLHFTGDIHAIGAANNLLAALLEAHILHANALGIDPLSVGWRRCVDINDRALRNVVVGVGGRANGYVRETGFDITAASEVMAIVAVARDLQDLRERLGAITVAYTFEGEPALVHCGPFANIAHGNNSLVADLVALKLGEYVVTESGFGADMGMEKFLNIVCRAGGLSPSAVVLVRRLALEAGAHAAELNEAFERGGAGAADLAEAVADAADHPNEFEYTYPIEAPIDEKIEAIATRVYGADGAVFLQTAKDKIKQYSATGLDLLPICMAKTHLSLSHDPELRNAPTGFNVTIRDVRAYTGAGWLVALCGTMQTMPGLGASPAAFDVDIDEDGRTVGLF